MESSLEPHLEQMVRRHAELRDALVGTGLTGADFARLSKEYSYLTPIVDGIDALRRARDELASLIDMAQSAEDAELKALAEDELQTLRQRLPALEQQVKLALLPKDADDARNAILEVRAGTGGEEAALFAAVLFRLYQRYAALRGWRFEILDLSETGLGGFKEASAIISGRDVFARLKFESGVRLRPQSLRLSGQLQSRTRWWPRRTAPLFAPATSSYLQPSAFSFPPAWGRRYGWRCTRYSPQDR